MIIRIVHATYWPAIHTKRFVKVTDDAAICCLTFTNHYKWQIMTTATLHRNQKFTIVVSHKNGCLNCLLFVMARFISSCYSCNQKCRLIHPHNCQPANPVNWAHLQYTKPESLLNVKTQCQHLYYYYAICNMYGK